MCYNRCNGDFMEDKTVYIILSYTGTILSKLIRIFTGAEYCHVSISLDKKLEKMYSFGRLNPYNPFIGGFVHENKKWGTFKRFKKTRCSIYSLCVSKKEYDRINKIIKNIKNDRLRYKFNILGMFVSAIHIKYQKKNSFYCAEFVKYVIENSVNDVDLPKYIKPIHFKNLENTHLLYEGKLHEYNM